MSPTLPRDTAEGRVYNDLRNLAVRHGRDVGEYLTLHCLEGFLDRLSRSKYGRHLVLKGGVLMASEVLEGLGPTAQPRWAAWRRKQRLTAATTERLQEVIDDCIAFIDPVITGSAAAAVWLPRTRAWAVPDLPDANP